MSIVILRLPEVKRKTETRPTTLEGLLVASQLDEESGASRHIYKVDHQDIELHQFKHL